jgi:serine/threonine protein kinase/tetratricopeptide (TPR) repeat protein
MVGQTLGHYRIDQQIGAGGMGVVFRARDQRLDRDVALKILPDSLLNDPAASDRLRKEALALSKLNHPNIAHIYDFDTQGGVAFLIMEYVQGDTLAKKLGSGPFPEEVAVSIGLQIASALEDAAEVGVVHRDIKPSNIMLTSKGAVKVLDFGLAKLFRSDEQDLTRSHSDLPDAAGTLPYMAPERLKSEPADFRSDIYSLGSVLYEAVTGKRPFVSTNSVTLIAEILNKKPNPPRDLNSTLSTGFDSTVMRCLAKEPARRYQRASELRAALESVRESRSDVAHIAPAPSFAVSRVLSLAALVVAMVVVSVFVWRALKNPPVVNASPPELAVLPLSEVGGNPEFNAFDNGLIETLNSRLTKLSKDHPLQVVPASEIRAKGVTTLQQAGKEFGATMGLMLTIQRSGDSIRVNYSLVDAKRHETLRADTIDAAASDPFALEDKVADSVVAALQIELTPAEHASMTQHGTTKPGAYDYYLQGRGYLQEFQEPKNVESAIAEFNHALAEDPTYALAYAGLGEAYWRKYQITRDAEWVSNSRSACDKSIALQKAEPAGHNCLGMVLTGTGAYEDSAKEYQLAASLQPTDDDAYRGLAVAYEQMNKFKDAEETFSKAIALRPGYWANYNWLGELFLNEGKYPDAEPEFSEVMALAPDSYVGYGNLGITYLSENQYTKALPLLQHSVDISANSENTSNLATLYFDLRRFADSARTNEKAIALNNNRYDIWGNLGDSYYWSPGERSKSFPAYHSAIDLAIKHLIVNPRDATTIAYLAQYCAMIGQANAATENINRALTLSPNDQSVLFEAALVFSQLNKPEKALDYLEKSVAAGYPANTLLDTPNLDTLHGNPRFQKLVIQVPKN